MNFQKDLEKIIENPENKGKKLLLHTCCAPCSSYPLEYLSEFFKITVFYYNPNITSLEEYKLRVEEQQRLINTMNSEGFGKYVIEFKEGEYEPLQFFQHVKGLEKEPEGGRRCVKCFQLRLMETAKLAKQGNFDFFTTSLTISPLKNAEKINEIGDECAKEYGTTWLPSDFKKKNGYKRSIELSHKYELYRQNYCGCIFSRNGVEHEKNT